MSQLRAFFFPCMQPGFSVGPEDVEMHVLPEPGSEPESGPGSTGDGGFEGGGKQGSRGEAERDGSIW